MSAPETNMTLPANRPALPENWVAKIFDHMSGLYGSKFSDLWRGSDLGTVRRMWAEKLSGFATMPKAIKEALDALDDKPYPPTLPEFLAMCREAGRRHEGNKPSIEYKPTQEEQARAADVIRKVSARIATDTRDHKAWARKLKVRHESGEILSLIQVNAYKEALAEESEEVAEALAA